jgi:uncharacterized circularly permuted ATP-grasp superfamily protein
VLSVIFQAKGGQNVKRALFIWVMAVIWATPFTSWARQTAYNEQEENGLLRVPYREFLYHFGRTDLTPSANAQINLMVGHPLNDKIHVLPIPLLYSQSEYTQTVAASSAQVGRALLAFFEDLVLGEGRAFGSNGFIKKSLAQQILKSMEFSRADLRAFYQGKSHRDISFLVGPDEVRGPDGKMYILEVNVGEIGGAGDIGAIRKAVAEEYAYPLPFVDTEQNEYELFIRHLLRQRNLHPEEVVAIFSNVKTAVGLKADMEDSRKTKILKKIGIPVYDSEKLSARELDELAEMNPRLVLNESGSHYSNEKLQKLLYHDFFRKRGVELLHSPGVDVLSSKAWLPFIDKMIEFYLHERPIALPPETHLLDGSPERLQQDEMVIKSADGSQGTGVSIIRPEDRQGLKDLEKFRALNAKIARTGVIDTLYVEQKYIEPSYIPTPWGNFKIDLRPVSHVSGRGGVYEFKTPYSRAAVAESDQLNNIAQGALGLAVILVPSKCSDIF